MLGSKKGIRDTKKAVNDMRSQTRQMKLAWTADPARKLELLIQERDARLTEAERARMQAYGWGAKKYVQVAEIAELHARKAEAQIQKIQAANPGVEATETPTRLDRFISTTTASADVDRRRKAGEITKLEAAAEQQQIDYNMYTKQENAVVPEKSHTVAVLLSIFLGLFGADRYYLGHRGMCSGKLIATFLAVGIIWWPIDAIIVAKKATPRLQVVNWRQSTPTRTGPSREVPASVRTTPGHR